MSVQEYVLGVGFDKSAAAASGNDDYKLATDEQAVLAMLRREETLRWSGALQQLLDARGQENGELIYRALQQHV